MKNRKKQVILLWACLLLGVGRVYAQEANYAYPETPFDQEATAKQLEPGTCAVRGKAFFIAKKWENYSGQGNIITLFPVTPYFTEYLEMRKKYRKGKKMPAMSQVAYSTRIEGKFMNDNGMFMFLNLKPGRYYIYTTIDYQKSGTTTVQTGTSTSYNIFGQALSSQPILSDSKFAYNAAGYVDTYVDVKEGETVDVIISNVK